MSEVITQENNDMDAFKELMTRSPDMELMTIDELHGMVFWAGAATKWSKLQIELAEKVGGLQEQIAAWRRDGQAAAELDFKATQRLGEIAKEEPSALSKKATGTGIGRGTALPSGDPPKWQRLGFKSDDAMKEAQYLANHKDEAQEIIEEARAADDFPSRTAVKNKVRAKRAEQIAKEAKERAESKRAEALDKDIEENKKFVSEYFRTIKSFRIELEKAIIGAEKGKFDHAGKNFIIDKHSNIRELMNRLEDLV